MRKQTLLFLFLSCTINVLATHVRSGELAYSYLGNNAFKVTVKTFTEIGGGALLADQDRLPLNWGDGSPIDTVFRVQKAFIASCINDQIQENVYEGFHTYAVFGLYVISCQDVNRVEGINNINEGISDQIPLYVEDSLQFLDPSGFGQVNSSPMLNSMVIAFDSVFHTFNYYPNATDPDGDSLSFSLCAPLQAAGMPVTNFVLPNTVNGTTGTFTMDSTSGKLTWDKSTFEGRVNIGIRVTEHRKHNGSYFVVGTLLRDLQIIIDITCTQLSNEVITVNKPYTSAFYDIEANKIILNNTGSQTINEVRLYDITGRLIMTDHNISDTEYGINASGLPAGLYILMASSSLSSIASKVMVTR